MEMNIPKMILMGKERFKKYPLTEYTNELRLDDEVYALFAYVSEMADTSNNIIDFLERVTNELNKFLSLFDDNLQQKVVSVLKEWQENGLLNIVINEAIQTQVDELELQLEMEMNYVPVSRFRHLKVAIAKGFDWSPAINAALKEAHDTNKAVFLYANEPMYVTQPIKPYPTSKIVSTGKNNTVLLALGAIKVIDLSDATAKTGVELSSFGIKGDKTAGQIGIDAYYLVNGSTVRDLAIEDCDEGMRLERSWYSAFSEIFMRGNVSYGLHGLSSSGNEQINGISFKSLFIQGGKHAVYLESDNVSAAIKFDSCTFERTRKTAVVSEKIAPLKFDNCYFESNYTDGATLELLRWDKPIDVKVTSTGQRNQVKFDSCYFARNNNFLESDQKTSFYIGLNVRPLFENCTFVCNSSNYIDVNIYSESLSPAKITSCSEDGYAKKMYVGVSKTEIVGYDLTADLSFTSTTQLSGVIEHTGVYTFRFTPSESKTTTVAATFRLSNNVDGSQIGTDIILPKTFTKGVPIDINLGNLTSGTIFKISAMSPSDVAVMGMTTVYRTHNS